MNRETYNTQILNDEVRPLMAHLAKKCWDLWSSDRIYCWNGIDSDDLTKSKSESANRKYSVSSVLADIDDATKQLDRASNLELLKQMLECDEMIPMTVVEERESGFFCASDELRQRRVRIEEHSIDATNKSNAHLAAKSHEADEMREQFQAGEGRLGQCEKSFPSSGIWTAGLFIITCCCAKKVVYLAFFMDSGESPRCFVNAIFNRFPVAPRILFYDNACHLQLYAMHRYWHYFFQTRFLCDKFHATNHSTCCVRYRPAAYMGDDISGANTQAVEQVNGLMKANALASVRCMTLFNAVVYITAYFFLLNSRN